jgi:general stress protein 26
MKTETQRNAGLIRLGKSIENATVVMLSSFDADGARLTRPMMPLEMDSDGRLWFFTDLHAAPAEHLCVANISFTDPALGTYVSLTGRNEIDTDRARVERLWMSSATSWFPDGTNASNLVLLKFVPDAIEAWDVPQGNVTEMFAKAASATAVEPAVTAEHEIATEHTTPLPHRKAA